MFRFIGIVATAIAVFCFCVWVVCNVCNSCQSGASATTRTHDTGKECGVTVISRGKNSDGIPVDLIAPGC
jgi:hypothetical protein